MKPGSVIVDLAADTGGNVAGSQPGKTIVMHDISIVGVSNIVSRMPVHASEMYASNLFNFISPFLVNGEFIPDWKDQILMESLFTHEGTVRNEAVKKSYQEQI